MYFVSSDVPVNIALCTLRTANLLVDSNTITSDNYLVYWAVAKSYFNLKQNKQSMYQMWAVNVLSEGINGS